MGAGDLWRPGWGGGGVGGAASFHSQTKQHNEIMVTGWEDVAMATQQQASLGMPRHIAYTLQMTSSRILLASLGLAYFPSCSDSPKILNSASGENLARHLVADPLSLV